MEVAIPTIMASKYTEPINTEITRISESPESRTQDKRYPSSKAWGGVIHSKLDKLDEIGTIRLPDLWTKTGTNPILLTLSFNYNRDLKGNIE